MTINWYGEGCFRIKAGNLDILVDPFESGNGLSVARFQPELTIKTLTSLPAGRHGLSSERSEQKDGRVIWGAGDYEVKGVEIRGWQLIEESNDKFVKTVYRVQAEDIKLGLLGHISQLPAADILEELGAMDVLVVPAGGPPFLAVADAVKIVKKLTPAVTVPSFFELPGLKRSAGNVKDFIKAADLPSESIDKLSIKKKDLVGIKAKIVTLLI